MPTANQAVQASRVRRILVTIPATGGTAVTLYSLVAASLSEQEKGWVMGGKVWVAGAAYHAGDSASSLPVAVADDETYSEPVTNFLSLTYVKSDAAAIANVPVSVYFLGQGVTSP